MNHTDHLAPLNAPSSVSAKLNNPDSSLAVVALTFPPAPIIDNGQIRLGAQSPMFGFVAGPYMPNMPSFPPELIADKGLVRLGAQSPIL